jgi:hypothetical protein
MTEEKRVLKEKGTSKRKKKKPREITEEEYIAYHRTGYIDPDLYKETERSMNWLKVEEYPILFKLIIIKGEPIELRKSGEKLQYVRTDKEDE